MTAIVWGLLKIGGGKLWALLRQLPWQVWFGVALLAAFLLYGHARYNAGVDETEARHRAVELKLQQRIAEERRKSEVATARIVTRVEYRTKLVRERGATIVKEVPRYVPLDSCPLPGGFRVLHNAAAAGVLPDPARIPFAAPVPAQVAASTTAANYATCLENAEAQNGLLAFGCANGWPVAPEVCAKLDVPSKQAAGVDEP